MKFFLLFVVIPITYTVDCLKIPCPEELAVNITNGIKDGIIITHEKVIYNESNYYRKNDTIFGCICNIRKPCIRKCCGPNEIMVNKNCVATSKDRITFPIHDGTVEINSSIKHHFVHNMKCKDKKMLLMPHYDDVDQFYIQSNGSLYLPKFLKQKMRNPEHYCIENFENKNLEMTGNLSAILCLFEEDLDDTKQAAVRAANVYVVKSEEVPCPKVLAINITDGVHIGKTIAKDGINYTEKDYFLVNETAFGCVCNFQKCVRKCCKSEEIMVNRRCARRNNTASFQFYDKTVPTDYQPHIYYVHNKKCKGNRTLLRPHKDGRDQFYLQKNGFLYLPYFSKKLRSPEEYCIETFDIAALEMNNVVSIILCLNENDVIKTSSQSHQLISTGMIISMPFLLLTFIAYALLPDRNLHMKALMIYVINLMMGYLLLVIIQLSDTKFAYTSCALIGYFCLFFFMVSFFWMNVICIDIWFTFSGLRGFSGSKKSAERKRFFMYCGYGFGVPSIQVIIVYIIQANASQNSQLSPGIADGQCFLRRGIPELLYFYGPMAILITTNIIFFAITAVKIRNIKKDTSMLKKEDSKRHSYENDKQTFNLYLKLLFAMGVNWSMEIISWAVIWKVENAPEYIWYLTDFCNAIYGVFIFFIFVFKRSTWRLLKKRYYSFIGKPHLAHSLTMTNTTRITSYSTNNSSVHENQRGGANDSRMLTSEA